MTAEEAQLNEQVENLKVSERVDLEKLDKLYSEKKLFDLHEALLKAVEENPNDVELLWRIVRSHNDVADCKPDDKQHREKHFRAAEEISKKALELDDGHWATNKWLAISLANVGKFKGTKEKINDGYLIKTHAEKAANLNPKDATTEYILGEFCWSVTELSWLERQAASLIYATPPSSSYEEALDHFLKADKLRPGQVRTTLSVGRCYNKLKKQDLAKEWFTKATKLDPLNEAEQKLIDEAKRRLESL